ncbi:hypothetical protein D7D52_35920 [Nocardia yunnanensis]|uniref:Uncharacterized protein n=1 Tax=Nocardia yunnanensis TaxID=2382165 RepID=A0A386ZLL7_9NOCA|nr:hypothetical protein [Nocardia yunnanensis]AYF78328.1 hypothetical protein D7D52_35920 [Nocardia yunnanensis]
MSDLFGGLPAFAGGATPDPEPPAPTPGLGPVVPPTLAEDYEEPWTRGDIRAPADMPLARPGQATTLWGAPERAAALWGPIEAADPVIGADDTALGTARIETHTTEFEIEMHSTSEHSTSLTFTIKARP